MTFLAVAPFGIPAAIFAGIFAAAGLIALMQLRAPKLALDSKTLRAGRIAIPRHVIVGATGYSGHEAFVARGRHLDPRAARLIIGDIDSVVKIEISDDADPTPYLLISTRRPDELCSALGFDPKLN